MVKIIFSALIYCCLVTGCASLNDKWHYVVVDDFERGSKPTNPEFLIRNYLTSYLKDPGSMQLADLSGVAEGYKTTNVVTQAPTLLNVNGYANEQRTHGWLVKVRVNAKNSYGGYVGAKMHSFVFRGDQIILHQVAD
jgi:hypothetical protein